MLTTIKNILTGNFIKMGYWREVENKLRSYEFQNKKIGNW